MGLITPYLVATGEWTPKLIQLRDRTLSGLGRLGAGLPSVLREEFSKTLEVVNSYYSNRMEGNPTRIGDIFAAQQGQMASSVTERNFQLEHLAHIKTTETMRARLQKDPQLSPVHPDFLQMLHREFYSALPESMRIATMRSGESVPIVPGEFRRLPASVGRHMAVTHEQLKDSLDEFSRAYDASVLSPQDTLGAIAAAHHRFLWIHPFSDGNGRVVRLMSEAMAICGGYEGHGLYSISRGLARRRGEYDAGLAAADAPRRNALDGRGNLSLNGLIEFSEFFMDIMADQVEFMATQMDLSELQPRWSRFLNAAQTEGTLSGSEGLVLKHLLRVGEMRRGDIQSVAGVERRQGSKIASRLLKTGHVQSASPKGPLRLKATRETARALFPAFFE